MVYYQTSSTIYFYKTKNWGLPMTFFLNVLKTLDFNDPD